VSLGTVTKMLKTTSDCRWR